MEEIKVFGHFEKGETLSRNQPDWGRIQKTATANGNTVTLFQGDAANSKNLQASLSAGATAIFIGHSQSVDNGQRVKTVAGSLSDKEIGQPSTKPDEEGAGRYVDNPLVGGLPIALPGELPANINSSSSVALFGCATSELADQYSGAASFVGVDSRPSQM